MKVLHGGNHPPPLYTRMLTHQQLPLSPYQKFSVGHKLFDPTHLISSVSGVVINHSVFLTPPLFDGVKV